MKKLFNTRERMADDMIDGYLAAFPTIIARGAHPRVVRRTVLTPGKVALLIGNGSGHEPIAMGFVGRGLLDANVVGDVFAAPSADLILEGIREVTGPAGAVLLISRHEGDVINGMGAAMMAEDAGLRVSPLLMYDDISSAPKGQEPDRRGAAGTIFIYKILGAAAEAGMALDDLVALGEDVRARTRTLGAALAPGISPLTGKPMFSLPEDEVFIGMGVHGEPGVGRRKVEPVRDLVAFMLTQLLHDRDIAPGTPTVVLGERLGRHHADGVADGLWRGRGGPVCARHPAAFADRRVVLHHAGNGWLFDLSFYTHAADAGLLASQSCSPVFSDHPWRGGRMMKARIHGVAVDAGSGLAAAIRAARGASAQPDDLMQLQARGAGNTWPRRHDIAG